MAQGAAHADQTSVGAAERVPAGDAVVVRAVRHHPADTGGSRLLNRQVRAEVTDHRTEAVAAVHQRRGGGLPLNHWFRGRIADGAADVGQVVVEAVEAVAEVAAVVGGDQEVGQVAGMAARGAGLLHHVHDEAAYLYSWDSGAAHGAGVEGATVV